MKSYKIPVQSNNFYFLEPMLVIEFKFIEQHAVSLIEMSFCLQLHIVNTLFSQKNPPENSDL